MSGATRSEDEKIRANAIAFARKNKKRIAKRVCDPAVYPREENPVSVFMAGSPGAGKTEASVELLESIGGAVLRIDPDILRAELPGYVGGNSWLFQEAVSILVDKILDVAFDQCQSFLLDGTLASYSVAERNIKRSVKRERDVQILYVYQDPQQAWQFVVAREALEGRRILVKDFINQYFAARSVVNALKVAFGKTVKVDLLLKNNDGSHRLFQAGVDKIDNHIPEKYDAASLEQLLGIG